MLIPSSNLLRCLFLSGRFTIFFGFSILVLQNSLEEFNPVLKVLFLFLLLFLFFGIMSYLHMQWTLLLCFLFQLYPRAIKDSQHTRLRTTTQSIDECLVVMRCQVSGVRSQVLTGGNRWKRPMTDDLTTQLLTTDV